MADTVQGAEGAQGAAAPAFTQAQLDAINAAVGGRLAREMAPLQASIEALKALTEKHSESKAKPASATETDPMKRMAAELAESNARHDKLVADLAAQRQQKRNDDAFAALKTTLTPHVRGELLDVAAERLFHIRKAVTASEDGRVSFLHEGTPYGLAEGVAAWTRTKEAEVFLPPPRPGQRAAHQVPGRPTGPRTEETTIKESPAEKSLRQIQELRARAGQ